MLPTWLRSEYANYHAHPIHSGRSGAHVFRLASPGLPARYVKIAVGEGRSDLIREADRLAWLADKFPVAELIQLTHFAEETALVTSALVGDPLTAVNDAPADVRNRYAQLLGAVLQRFHATDIVDCPFVHASEGGSDHPDGLTDPAKMRIYETLQERYSAHFPSVERRVLLHGDPSLPNVIVSDAKLTGFIDLGTVGMGDALRDIALALWSLQYNYGPGFSEHLLMGYGLRH